MDRYFGCHVSASGGIFNAALRAEQLKVNSIQLHPSPPQRWNRGPFTQDAAEKFKAQRKKELQKVFFHAVYLINLAAPDPAHFEISKTSLIHYLNLCSSINGDGVIFHVGSMKDQSSEQAGYQRAADGINAIMEKATGAAPLLLEVSAGSGKVIGDRFEDLAAIYELLEQKERIGFALDTQHMWASGYDLDTDLDGVVTQADSILGLSRIMAIHLNDSKTEKGSHKDRHENLGDGLIGAKVLTEIINHQKLKHIPFILETPGLAEPETAPLEVEKLRKIVGARELVRTET